VPFWKLSLESLGCGGGLIGWGKCEQGFRRMAARNKPAGIRSLVYGMGKGKAGIEGLSVSRACFERGAGGLSMGLDQAEHDGLFGRFLAAAD
jgi:hypothetical protein